MYVSRGTVTMNRSGRCQCRAYRNAEFLPGVVEVQSSTLDDPGELVPPVQIQVAERLDWMRRIHELPEFERFPG